MTSNYFQYISHSSQNKFAFKQYVPVISHVYNINTYKSVNPQNWFEMEIIVLALSIVVVCHFISKWIMLTIGCSSESEIR
jgi:uncharacterized membrane protein YhdT